MPKHLEFKENQRGITFEALFSDYLRGARRIMVTDPYIRLFFQIRNFMEFVETVLRIKPEDEEVHIHLVTVKDEFKGDLQETSFQQIKALANWMQKYRSIKGFEVTYLRA